MINLEQRAESLNKLLHWLDGFFSLSSKDVDDEYANLDEVIQSLHIYNPWFIPQFSRKALEDFRQLFLDNLPFLVKQIIALDNQAFGKKIVLIPSHNIPLSGAFELIILFLTGQQVIFHNNNHKDDLLQLLTQKLVSFEPHLNDVFQWTDSYPKEIDGWVIHDKPEQKALHYYFEKRNSLFIPACRRFQVLNGSETNEELIKIADNIFIYWGFSSYNVRKIYVPKGYNFNLFFEAIEKYSFLYQYNCYANNYDYHKSVLLMNQLPFLDNGFILLREDASLSVPIGCLYFEYYSTSDEAIDLTILSEETALQRELKTAELLFDFVKHF